MYRRTRRPREPSGKQISEGAGEAHVRQPERSADAELWRVHSGEMLRDVLARWGGHAGVEVLFLTDRRYRLHEGADVRRLLRRRYEGVVLLPLPPATPAGGCGEGEWRRSGRDASGEPAPASPHRPGRAGDGQ